MEFIRVHFDPRDIRWVIANGNIVGPTEAELTLPSNFYVITLSGDGYSPAEWSGVVTGTVPGNPCASTLPRSEQMKMRPALLLISALLLAGCSITRFENTALQSEQANPERRSINPATADRPAILMTFSGGGSRAAALAASVLGEMAATRYAASDGPHVLTEDVKLISSVSGGSVTAAWFGLRRTAEHPDGQLDGLRQNFLVRDNMKELELDAVEPITWFRLTFSGFSRIGALEYCSTSASSIKRPSRTSTSRGSPSSCSMQRTWRAAKPLPSCRAALTMSAQTTMCFRLRLQSLPRRHFQSC